MGIHVNGVYVVGGNSNKKGDIIVIYKYRFYMYGYWFYYTIKGNHKNEKGFFAEDSQFEKDLVYYGCDYSDKLKGNWEEDNMDEKIVVLRNDKAVTATKYMDGKKVNSATAKCHPDDKFDFNVGAKIAVDRLIRENNNTDRKTIDKTLGEAKEELKQKVDKLKSWMYIDLISNFWDNFKEGKIQVRVTSKNIKKFLQIAKNKGIEWSNRNTFNPFDYPSPYFYNLNVVYLMYEYKCDPANNGLKYDIYCKKDMMVVDWDEILPLLLKRIVYSNDFSWDKFLNGEIVIQVPKENSFYFFWQFGAIGLFRFYDIFADYEPFINFVYTLDKNDSVWCKMKDGRLVFRKAYDRSFGLSPTIFIYKYDGKKI